MKLATCNEPWRGTPVEEVFRVVARIGYEGVEIAPFTLADHVGQISAARRKAIRKAAEDVDLAIIGLHWLFVSPKGLHLTAPDQAVRQRTLDYLKSLVDFCSDIGGHVMIVGSPQQRNIEPPNTFEEGWKRVRDMLASVAPTCADRDVTICIEALSPKETNFIQTLEESSRFVDEIGHPNIDVMLDCKAIVTMPDGIEGTIRKHGRRAKHFHANEPCGKGVGMPLNESEGVNVDWQLVLAALTESGYEGWVSCEPFDYHPDPTTVAETGFSVLREAMC